MFKDIVKTLKGIAVFYFVIGIAGAISSFITLIVLSTKSEMRSLIGFAFLGLFGSFLVGYIASAFTYGFATLIENTYRAGRSYASQSYIPPQPPRTSPVQSQPVEHTINPSITVDESIKDVHEMPFVKENKRAIKATTKANLDVKLETGLISKEEYEEELSKLYNDND